MPLRVRAARRARRPVSEDFSSSRTTCPSRQAGGGVAALLRDNKGNFDFVLFAPYALIRSTPRMLCDLGD